MAFVPLARTSQQFRARSLRIARYSPELFSSPPLMVSTRAPPAGHLHPSSARRPPPPSSTRRIHPRPELYPPPLELLPTPPEPTPTSPSIRGRRAELRAPAASTRAPPGGRLCRAPPNGSIRGRLHAPAARLACRLRPGAPPLCVDRRTAAPPLRAACPADAPPLCLDRRAAILAKSSIGEASPNSIASFFQKLIPTPAG